MGKKKIDIDKEELERLLKDPLKKMKPYL